MRTLIVIPTYEERENVSSLIENILREAGDDVDVLVVDDASPDGTGEVVDRIVEGKPGRVHVLHRRGKLGLGSAYLDGFRFGMESGYQRICEMDADGSHDPKDLLALFAAMDDGAAVVIGSRRIRGGRVEGWGPHRHLMSGGAMLLSRLALGLKTKDVTSGFRCYSQDAIRMLLASSISSGGYAFQEETLFRCEKAGMVVVEVPIVFRDRKKGRSKLSSKDVLEFFSVIRRLRREKA